MSGFVVDPFYFYEPPFRVCVVYYSSNIHKLWIIFLFVDLVGMLLDSQYRFLGVAHHAAITNVHRRLRPQHRILDFAPAPGGDYYLFQPCLYRDWLAALAAAVVEVVDVRGQVVELEVPKLESPDQRGGVVVLRSVHVTKPCGSYFLP
jgi:hypothetical protein